MRLLFICFATLWLAGCANTGGTQGSLGGSVPRPKAVLISDFAFSSDVVAVDRGFTTRLERKVGAFPTFERKQRTAERVNDEIVAVIIATVRETGLDAQPGNEDALSLSDDVIVVTGRLRPSDLASIAAKKNQIGFGAGRGGVTADMAVSSFSSGGRKQLTGFTAEGQDGRRGAANAKLAAAQNSAIAAALAAQNSKEKLSPDVEVQARRLGRAVGEKIVAFAREQGWLTKVENAEAQPEEKPVKLPAAKPQKKPAKPDAQEKPTD